MKCSAIFFRAEFRSSRLNYILHEILHRRLGLTYSIVGKDEPLPEGALAIGYGFPGNAHLEFPDSGILQESVTGQIRFIPGFENYHLETSRGKTQNDLFGTAFYLLSRYREQTYAGETDEHGRVPDTACLDENFRKTPLIEFWVDQLRHQLESSGIQCKKHLASLEWSLDWDNPTAYFQKGIWRNSASIVAEILLGKWSSFRKRTAVLWGKATDPYATIGREISLDSAKGRRVFFWTGDYGKHDKGLSFKNQWYRNQIRELSRHIIPGLHPSYASFRRPEQILMEKKRLEEILDQPILASRFHFLRFRLPESYQMLEEAGISDDFSMGFSTIPGFRAGTALPFHWFDLSKNQAGKMLIHPFSLMDSSAVFRSEDNSLFLQEARRQFSEASKLGYHIHALFHNEHAARPGWEATIEKYMQI